MKINLLYIPLFFQLTVAQDISVSSFSITNNDLVLFEHIAKHIINLNFGTADTKITGIENYELHHALKQLSTILYYQGQECLPLNYETFLHHKNPILKSINYLVKAYDELYHKPNEGTSFPFFLQAYTLAEKTNNLMLRKLALMGILEFYRYEYSQTSRQYEIYLKEFLDIASSPIDLSWFHIYEIYFKSQSIFESERNAIEAINKLEKQVKKLNTDHKVKPLYFSLKAVQLEFINNYKEAEEYHFMAIDKSHNYPFLKYIKFRSNIRLADLYYKKGLNHTEKANLYIDSSDSTKSHLYIQQYKAKNNYGLNKYKKAYDLLLKTQKRRDSLNYIEHALENSKLEIQLQTAEKEKQILRNQNIVIVLGSVLLLGSCVGFLLLKNIKRKQRIAEQEKEIQIQKTEKILKEQELASVDAMLAGQEKERQRLANDLHDSLGGTLATVKLHFEHLKSNPNHKDADVLYTKTDALLQEAYQKVRTIAHEKNSGVMANQGLLPAIKNLAKKVSYGNHLTIDIQDYGLEQRLDNHIEITIFRIIQELITNIIKHANATEIQISLTNHDAMLNIIVEDNGKGFDPRQLPQKEGMGLSTIEKRIEHLEGTFEIDSTAGKGTNIIINIPI